MVHWLPDLQTAVPPILALHSNQASCVYVCQDRNMVKLNQSRTERVKFGVYLPAFFMRIDVRMASRKSPRCC